MLQDFVADDEINGGVRETESVNVLLANAIDNLPGREIIADIFAADNIATRMSLACPFIKIRYLLREIDDASSPPL